MDRNDDVITFFSKNLFFKKKIKKAWDSYFADIIKIVIIFIRKIVKDSRKVRRIRNYVSKWNLYLYFLI